MHIVVIEFMEAVKTLKNEMNWQFQVPILFYLPTRSQCFQASCLPEHLVTWITRHPHRLDFDQFFGQVQCESEILGLALCVHLMLLIFAAA